MTPRQSVRAECERRGLDAVAAEYVLAGGEGGRGGYWPRVWAARGLLHAWADVAAPAIIRATADES
jgi:hypothetical protein